MSTGDHWRDRIQRERKRNCGPDNQADDVPNHSNAR